MRGRAALLPAVLAVAVAGCERTAAEGWEVEGEVALDRRLNHAGGSSLRLAPGSSALWRFGGGARSGRVELWVYDDGTVPPDPATYRIGPRWGLVEESGRVHVVGAFYAPPHYGRIAERYALSRYFLVPPSPTPFENFRTLDARRRRAWRRWKFELADGGALRVFVDDTPVRGLDATFELEDGFVGVVLLGEDTKRYKEKQERQTIWVDDIVLEVPGREARRPSWPPLPDAPDDLPDAVSAAGDERQEPRGAVIEESLRGRHPRLLFVAEDVDRLRALATGDGRVFLDQLEAYLPLCQVPLHTEFQSDPLDAQRQGFWRLPSLALHHVLTGEAESLGRSVAFLERLEGRTLADDGAPLCAPHLLAGLALAYDWLLRELDAALAERLRRKLFVEAERVLARSTPPGPDHWQRAAASALAVLAATSSEDSGSERATFRAACAELQRANEALERDGGRVFIEAPPASAALAELALANQAADRCLGTRYSRGPFYPQAPFLRLHTAAPGFAQPLRRVPRGVPPAFAFGIHNQMLWQACASHDLADAQAGLWRLRAVRPQAFKYGWLGLVGFDPGLRGGSIEGVPQTALFPELGLACVRDGWDRRSVAASLDAASGPGVESAVPLPSLALYAHGALLHSGGGGQPGGLDRASESEAVLFAEAHTGSETSDRGLGRRALVWVRGDYVLVVDTFHGADEDVHLWSVEGPALTRSSGGSDRFRFGDAQNGTELVVVAAAAAVPATERPSAGATTLELRVRGPSPTVVSLYDLWGHGGLELEMDAQANAELHVGVRGRHFHDEWRYEPPAGESSTGGVTGSRHNGFDFTVPPRAR